MKGRGDYVPVVTVSRHPLPWVVRLAGGWAWPVGVAAEGGSDAVTGRSDRCDQLQGEPGRDRSTDIISREQTWRNRKGKEVSKTVKATLYFCSFRNTFFWNIFVDRMLIF